MNIATNVIQLFGGAPVVAKITGAHVTRVYRWTYDEARGGTGGTIPQKHWPALLRAAKAKGLKLSIHDLYSQSEAA